MTRLKLAELTSGVGALVLGVGLGAMFPGWLGSMAGTVTVIGLFMHAFGMWDKHRIDSVSAAANPKWVDALYWICWILLAAVMAMLVVWSR